MRVRRGSHRAEVEKGSRKMARRVYELRKWATGTGRVAAEMEVVKTEVEEIADGGESGGEGGARHCAPYGSARWSRKGKGKSAVWGPPSTHRRDAFRVQRNDEVVRQDGG